MGPHRPPSLATCAWLGRDETQAVFRALAADGYEGRAVGGAVRNSLIGKAVTDIDIATNAPPEETMRLTRAAGLAAVPTGIDHGTITVIANHHPFEVTTLREDVATFGRHATVAFTADWEADARRRDFTINALYCSADGTVHDPLGGWPDLVARRVRFIGDATQRIREDYLRILRFFRFHAEYATGPMDTAGLVAAVRERRGLDHLSGERLRQELLKLLAAPGAVEGVDTMASHGILTEILPVAPRHGILRSLTQCEDMAGRPAHAVLRLAALTIAVAEDTSRIAARLKLSNQERATLARSAARRGLHPEQGEKFARAALYRLGADAFTEAVLLTWASAARRSAPTETWRDLLELPARWPVPRLPVTGADVIARGSIPGPDIGRLLAAIEQDWIAADFPDDRPWLLSRLDDLMRKP